MKVKTPYVAHASRLTPGPFCGSWLRFGCGVSRPVAGLRSELDWAVPPWLDRLLFDAMRAFNCPSRRFASSISWSMPLSVALLRTIQSRPTFLSWTSCPNLYKFSPLASSWHHNLSKAVNNWPVRASDALISSNSSLTQSSTSNAALLIFFISSCSPSISSTSYPTPHMFVKMNKRNYWCISYSYNWCFPCPSTMLIHTPFYPQFSKVKCSSIPHTTVGLTLSRGWLMVCNDHIWAVIFILILFLFPINYYPSLYLWCQVKSSQDSCWLLIPVKPFPQLVFFPCLPTYSSCP